MKWGIDDGDGDDQRQRKCMGWREGRRVQRLGVGRRRDGKGSEGDGE